MNGFKVGDKVTIRGQSWSYGTGVIIRFVQTKAIVEFYDGAWYIPVVDLMHCNF